MTPISELDAGRLLEAVEDLKAEVGKLRGEVDKLKTAVDRGRGVLATILAIGGLAAGAIALGKGIGAAVRLIAGGGTGG